MSCKQSENVLQSLRQKFWYLFENVLNMWAMWYIFGNVLEIIESGIEPSWTQWETVYETTGLHSPFLSWLVHVCPHVWSSPFFHDCKGIVGGTDSITIDTRWRARSSPFLVKFLYLCPGGHSWTPFNLQLNPKGSVFGQRLSPIKGFQREPSTTGDFCVKVRWKRWAKKSALSAKTRRPCLKLQLSRGFRNPPNRCGGP